MANEINPLTLDELPEGYIKNEDGSVEIPMEVGEDDEEVMEGEEGGFLDNLAELLPESYISLLGSEYSELIEKDKQSRDKRDKQYEEGLRRTGLGDDAPGGADFDGASRVVHPVLAEACVDFSSRAIKELFPASGPVKAWVNGDVTPQKLERSDRKTRFMNWQLTTEIKEYREELEQLLTQLPLGGSQFQKFWWDSRRKRICCEFVPVDEIYLPYSASSFLTTQRFTHRQLITKDTLQERINSGLYRDIFLSLEPNPELSATEQANEKIEGLEDQGYNEDGLRAVLEIHCWMEVPEDRESGGEYSPYILTIDEATEQVLSLYRNWDAEDPTRERIDWFVEWKFIPWRGALAIGLLHLIGGLSSALTGAIRALLDSAHINNAPTMLKLKSGRIGGQTTTVNVTQVCDIEGPANVDDIRKLAMPMPFNPPSSVLAGLIDQLYGLAKNVVQTAEDKVDQIGDRTPVGTTMAMIEQGSHTYSAIHARLHESQKRSLAIIHRLNSLYLDEGTQVEALGGITIDRTDFAGTMDVLPVSDPTIFSESQRYAQAQAVMQMSLQDSANPRVPWNLINVRRRMLKQMRVDNIDELLPPEKPEITGDVLTENTQAMQGSPLKASKEQDHEAHIQGHLSFLESPIQLANPLVQGQPLMALLAHVNEHIQMLVAKATADTAQAMSSQMGLIPDSEDRILAQATQQANVQLTQRLAPMLDQIAQIQQQIQKKMPPPQMPPEVQASLQIAQMDTQRKAQADQSNAQLKAQELQRAAQMDQANLQFRAGEAQANQARMDQQQQFDQMMAQMSMRQDDMHAQLRHQMELARNQQDNHQKQVTELLKNRDDNHTKVLIEQLKSQLSGIQQSQPDLSPQLDQLNSLLDQLGGQSTQSSLAEVLREVGSLVQSLNNSGE